jgi:ribonuclease HI
MTSAYTLFFDGASRGNPGKAAAGAVLYGSDKTIVGEVSTYLGVKTNNQAEYIALVLGLQKAITLGIKNIHVYGDSLLVIKQMKGEYKVKNAKLLVYYKNATTLAKSFESISFTHVQRHLNAVADKLANDAFLQQRSS